MITLRCTQKLRKYLGIVPADFLEPSTATLGDWYANLVPTLSGDLILMVNEKSLICVAIPVWVSNDLLPQFRSRVVNLLGMMEIPWRSIETEISHYERVQFAKTASPSILGSMNDIAWQFQIIAEEAKSKSDLSLSRVEFKLSNMPCKSLGFRFPYEVAEELLGKKEKNDKVNHRKFFH